MKPLIHNQPSSRKLRRKIELPPVILRAARKHCFRHALIPVQMLGERQNTVQGIEKISILPISLGRLGGIPDQLFHQYRVLAVRLVLRRYWLEIKSNGIM